MQAEKLKLFIIDDDRPMAITLKNYLYSKFGQGLNIFIFDNGENCLQQVDDKTDMVIMDAHPNGTDGIDLLKSIKTINPKTEVIIFSSNQDVATAIQSFRKGATDFVTKDQRGINRITYFINQTITEPIRRMVREYGVNKFVVIFLSTFLLMGIAVYLVLKYIFHLQLW